MTGPTGVDVAELVVLRQRAVVRAGTFGELAPIAATVGTAFPDAATIRRSVAFLSDVDLPQVLADLDAVVGAYRQFTAAIDAVGAQAAGASWQGRAGTAACDAINSHSRSGRDLIGLISLAQSASPALEGLKMVLPNVFRAIDDVTAPVLAGHPLPTVAAALATGTLRPSVVADEVGARVRLFDTATRIGRTAVRDILAELVGVDVGLSAGELALAGER